MRWLRNAQTDQLVSDVSSNDTVSVSKLPISFDQIRHDYVIYAPWNQEEYVTYIGDYTMGYGARYLLLRAIDDIIEDMGDEVNNRDIKTKPLPKGDAPVVRRLGNKKWPDGPIEKKIKEQQRYLSRRNENDFIADGNEYIYTDVNRREENFEKSHA